MKRFGGRVVGRIEGCNGSENGNESTEDDRTYSRTASTLQDGILLSTITSTDELTNLMWKQTNNNPVPLTTTDHNVKPTDSVDIPVSATTTAEASTKLTQNNNELINNFNLINVTINDTPSNSNEDDDDSNQQQQQSFTLQQQQQQGPPFSTFSVNVDQENYILRNSNNGSDDGVGTNVDGEISSIFFLNNFVDEQHHDNDEEIEENCFNNSDPLEHKDIIANCCINCGEYVKDEETVNCAAVVINDCDYRLDINLLTNSSHSEELLPFLRPIAEWTNENVISWLEKMNLKQYVRSFEENNFQGNDLLNILDENDQQYEQLISALNVFLLEHQEKKMKLKKDKSHLDCESCTKIMMLKSALPLRYRRLCRQCNKCKLQMNCNCGVLSQKQSLTIPKEKNTEEKNIPIFMSLCHQLIDAKLQIPILLQILINEIEFKLTNYKDNLLIYMDAILSTTNYHLINNNSKNVKDIDVLWDKLIAEGILSTSNQPPEVVPNNATTHTLFSINLHDYSLKCVVGVLKRFLCNLIDPVMSAHWYNLFISTQNLKYSSDKITNIFHLINQLLPQQHLATLSYLMSHLCFLKILMEQKNLLYKWDDLLDVWCNFIIRPPAKKIFKIIECSDKHLNILKILLMFGKWRNSFQDAKIISDISNKSPIVLNSSKIQQLNEEVEFLLELYKEDWYFGHLTRQDCTNLLRNAEDGTFIVRNSSTSISSSSKSSPVIRTRNYTLHLKNNNNDCVIKILNYNNSTYGFTSDIQFPTLKELISFYRKNSLKQYNSELCIKLKSTIPRYLCLNSEYSLNNQQLDHIKFDKFFKSYCNCKMNASGLHNLFSKDNLNIFSDMNRTFFSYVMLKYLINTNMYTQECDYNNEKVQLYLINVDRLKMNLKEISSYCIKQHGLVVPPGTLPPQLPSLQPPVPPPRTSAVCDVPNETPQFDQTKWFLENCSRTEANQLLDGKPPGTFLIRSRTCDNNMAQMSTTNTIRPYALTLINYNNEINHCIICQKVNNRCYGFAEPLMIFKTLMDLVLYYRDCSMEVHSSCLKIKLKYPLYS